MSNDPLYNELFAVYKRFASRPNDKLTQRKIREYMTKVMNNHPEFPQFRVICDDTNNPPSIVSANDLHTFVTIMDIVANDIKNYSFTKELLKS